MFLCSASQANEEIETNNEIKVDKYKRPAAFSIKGTLLKLDKKLQKDFYLVEDAFVFEKMPFLLYLARSEDSLKTQVAGPRFLWRRY